MRTSMTPSIFRRVATRESGFSLIELTLVVAILLILVVLATPMFLRYYQAAQANVAAREIVAFLNQGRQLAIAQNRSICVHIDATTMHYHQGSCSGDRWIAPGTDSTGDIDVFEGVTLAANDSDPIFTYLGAATPVTYTLTHTKSGITQTVVVAASGRVSIGP